MWSIPLISLGWFVLNFKHMFSIPLQAHPLLKSSHKLLNQWICLLWWSWTYMYGLGNNKQQSHLPYLSKAGFLVWVWQAHSLLWCVWSCLEAGMMPISTCSFLSLAATTVSLTLPRYSYQQGPYCSEGVSCDMGKENLFPSCNQYQSKRHLYFLLRSGTNIASFIIICHQASGSKTINSNVHLSSLSRCASAQLGLHLGKIWTVSFWRFLVKLEVFVEFVFTWT